MATYCLQSGVAIPKRSRPYIEISSLFSALRLPGHYENIEEIINGPFMRVLGASASRHASQVSTWMFGTAYRTALNLLRRQKNHNDARSIDDYPEQTIDPVLATEELDWLTQGLERLALELTYHMGIFRRRNCCDHQRPGGTVKARMSRARERIAWT